MKGLEKYVRKYMNLGRSHCEMVNPHEDILFKIHRKSEDWNPSLQTFDWEMKYLLMKTICIGDADWADPAHHGTDGLTITKVSDVVDVLTPYLLSNGLAARLYITKGGMRWFITSHRMTLEQAGLNGMFLQLPILDPYYIQGCIGVYNGKKVDKFGYSGLKNPVLERMQSSWAARVSPKKGRLNDFVAFPLGKLGVVKEDPTILSAIKHYHDNEIQQYWTPESRKSAVDLIMEKSSK